MFVGYDETAGAYFLAPPLCHTPALPLPCPCPAQIAHNKYPHNKYPHNEHANTRSCMHSLMHTILTRTSTHTHIHACTQCLVPTYPPHPLTRTHVRPRTTSPSIRISVPGSRPRRRWGVFVSAVKSPSTSPAGPRTFNSWAQNIVEITGAI